MRYLKIMGLCLVAVFVMSAGVVASASAAEPELVKKGGGAVVKKKFTGKGVGKKFILETKGQGSFECTALSAKGEVKSATEWEETVTFTGCTAFGIEKCSTEKAKEGEIVATLSIRPRWAVGGIGSTVLFLLSILPVPTGDVVILCGPQTLKILGTFLVPAGPVNTPHKILLADAKQKGGVQEPIEYENEAKEKIKNTLETLGEGLKTFGKTQSGVEGEDEVTFEEEVEFV